MIRRTRISRRAYNVHTDELLHIHPKAPCKFDHCVSSICRCHATLWEDNLAQLWSTEKCSAKLSRTRQCLLFSESNPRSNVCVCWASRACQRERLTCKVPVTDSSFDCNLSMKLITPPSPEPWGLAGSPIRHEDVERAHGEDSLKNDEGLQTCASSSSVVGVALPTPLSRCLFFSATWIEIIGKEMRDLPSLHTHPLCFTPASSPDTHNCRLAAPLVHASSIW